MELNRYLLINKWFYEYIGKYEELDNLTTGIYDSVDLNDLANICHFTGH